MKSKNLYYETIKHKTSGVYSNSYLFLLLLFSFLDMAFLSPASAQTEDWIWAQNAGGIFNEARGERIATDNDGHVIVAGTYSCPQITFGSITLNNNGGDDLFVVKMDTSGNVLWAKSAGGSYAEEGYTVAVDDAGNVYVSGQFWSSSVTFGSITIVNSGSGDIFLAKYDAAGNVLWAKSATGADEDISNAVAVDLDGNVYITGSYVSDTIDFGGVILANSQATVEDMFIAKYDEAGNAIWARHATGAAVDKGFGVAADPAGNVMVSGHFSSGTLTFGSQMLFNSGGFDVFLVKYDALGNVLWATNPAGSGYDFNFSMEMDADGNACLTGHFSSFLLTFGTVTIFNTGGDDIYVVKYDANGTALWAQEAGGTSYDYGYDVAVDGEGNVFLTGNFQSPTISFGSITLINSTSFADFYIVKYDSSGDLQWAKNGASSDYTFGRGCGADSSGNLYVTGLFGNSTLTLGNLTLTTVAGATDMFIARYGNSYCTTVYYQDADADGYGNAAVTTIACTPPSGYVSDSTDCNDADATVYGPVAWFLDADGDQFGQPEVNMIIDCIQPFGYVDNDQDCDDSSASVYPGAVEIPNNGIDEDCDGLIDEVATSTDEFETDESVFSFFPNPVTDYLTMHLKLNDALNGNATIVLYGLQGQKAGEYQSVMKNGLIAARIDLSAGFDTGMYMVSIKVKDAISQEEKTWRGRIVYQQ